MLNDCGAEFVLIENLANPSTSISDRADAVQVQRLLSCRYSAFEIVDNPNHRRR